MVNRFLECIVEEIYIDLIIEFFSLCEVKKDELKLELGLNCVNLELFGILYNVYKKRRNFFDLNYFYKK